MNKTLFERVQSTALEAALERADRVIHEEAIKVFRGLVLKQRDGTTPYTMTLEVLHELGILLKKNFGERPEYPGIALAFLQAINQVVHAHEKRAAEQMYLAGKADVYANLALVGELEKIIKRYKEEIL